MNSGRLCNHSGLILWENIVTVYTQDPGAIFFSFALFVLKY